MSLPADRIRCTVPRLYAGVRAARLAWSAPREEGGDDVTMAGDVIENAVTGERAVVRIGTAQTAGAFGVVDLYIRPRGAVVGEHWHPAMDERFTMLRGRVNFRLDGREQTAERGVEVHVPAGVRHDWWNAGDEEALVRVEARPAARFEAMILNFFGLAQDGRTNARGLPNPLQLALLVREFSDVIRFTRPPPLVQAVLFGLLAPVARMRGYRASYPEYLTRRAATGVPLEP
jgi:quercetin dioxygenase-like cupin family protein